MKIEFLLIALIIASKLSIGQDSRSSFGIEGGPSYVYYRGNDIIRVYDSPAIRGMIGVYLKFPLTQHSSLLTNISYEIKGETGKGIRTDISPCNCTTRAYLEYGVINLFYRISVGQKHKYYLQVGPFGGYLFRKQDISTGKDFEKVIIDDTKYYRHLDFGVAAGLGMRFPINEKISFCSELRNNFGLSNISKVRVYRDGTIKSNSVILLMGFSMYLSQFETAPQKINRF